jgi:hypothetical protein
MQFEDVERVLLESSNKAQLSRYRRMVYETHFIVSCRYALYENDPSKVAMIEFKITGSQHDIYTVTVAQDNLINCDCPDALCNCHGTGCYCKHVCFALSKVGHIFDPTIFQRKRLTNAEKDVMVNRIKNILVDQTLVNLEYLDAYRKAKNCSYITDSLFDASNARNLEDDCSICHNKLNKAKICELRCCPACNNAVHTECIIRWISIKKCCVMCCDESFWTNILTENEEQDNQTLSATTYMNIREHIPSLRHIY